MPRKVDSSQKPPRPAKTQDAQKPDAASKTADPNATTEADPASAQKKKAADSAWAPQQPGKPSDPGAPDEYHTARLLRVSKEVGVLSNQYGKLQNAVAGGINDEFLATGSKGIGTLKGMSAEQTKVLWDAAKEVAGRKAALDVMTSWPAAMARLKPTQAETTLEMGKVTQKALADGTAAAQKYLGRFVDAETAQKMASQISNSKLAGEWLTNATKAGSFMKWVGVAAHGLTGLMTVYDFGKAVQVQRDPNASTGQKVAGWITAAADAAMFVPFPPVQIAGAVLSVGGALFRDSKHPLKDIGDWISTKTHNLGSLTSLAPTPAS